jgi:hypothetical protein
LVRLAVILVALLPAISPGMNVSALLHAVELCGHLGSHDHDEPSDCPHDDSLSVESRAMPTAPVQASVTAALETPIYDSFRAPPRSELRVDAACRERPPPGVPRIGVVLLQV